VKFSDTDQYCMPHWHMLDQNDQKQKHLPSKDQQAVQYQWLPVFKFNLAHQSQIPHASTCN
jgi:hypothetical protein